jgi:chromosome segregation ATPase
MSSSILISRGKQILDYEQRIAQLQASKKNSISDLNTQLRRLETDRTTLREELNAQLASYKPQKDKPQKEQSSVVSSLSSILSLKFGAASPKPVDPMSVINAKRQRIEKMDASIAQNIDLVLYFNINALEKEGRRSPAPNSND